jgi:hypothetical protein
MIGILLPEGLRRDRGTKSARTHFAARGVSSRSAPPLHRRCANRSASQFALDLPAEKVSANEITRDGLAWYPDHADCHYFGALRPSLLRSVGWLERGKPYTRGIVEPAIIDALSQLLKEPWEPCFLMGFHECDLCSGKGQYGKNNLFVPGDGFLFVSPELILHYIKNHEYVPPVAFCEAVLACPPMNSKAYLETVEPIWQKAKYND